MTPPDLTRVHPFVRAWLRKALTTLPDPPRATAAEANEAVPIDRWAVKQDRLCLLRIEGVLVAADGYEFSFRVSPPFLVDPRQRLIWTTHGWLRLGLPADLPAGEPLLGALETLGHWCDLLREGLRHG